MTNDNDTKPRIAVLGMGAMGSRVAERLLAAGHEVTVWNRTAAACGPLVGLGARQATTPAEAAEAAAVVWSMLADDHASRAAWLGGGGAADTLPAGAVAVEAATVTPGWLAELSGSVGGRLVAAPVIGSRPQAEAGQLIVLAGGDADAVARLAGVFDAVAGRAIHVGTPAQAAAAKLAVNGFFATQVAAAAEALTHLRNAGVGDERALDVLADLPVTAAPIAGALRGMTAGRYDPMFPVRLVVKDLAYLTADGGRPLAGQARELYAAADGAGHGGENIHAVVRAFGDG